MTSTEFNIGYDGSRASSKVLKPPGGGASDIFGLGSSHYVTNGERQKGQQPNSTQDRLFGSSSSETLTPAKFNKMQSNIFENGHETAPKSVKKKFVQRNPITGEVTEIEIDAEENLKDEKESGEINTENGKELIEEQEKTFEIPNKPVQTSIRVRNPPGGKSSGIF